MKAFLLLFCSLPLLAGCREASADEDDSAKAETTTASASSEEPQDVFEHYDEANPGASLAALEAGDSASTLKFDRTEFDLGKIRQDGHFPVEFPFVVEGEDSVTITALQPSCGCTEPRLEVDGEIVTLGDEITPGTHGKVIAQFNSQSFKGPKSSNITVLSNAKNHRAVVKLKAFIQTLFEVTPLQVRFGNLTQGEAASADVKVLALEPFEIEEWEKLPPGIEVEEINEPEPVLDGAGQIRWYRVSVSPEAGTGMLYGSCVANTSLGQKLEIFVSGQVAGKVRFLPDHRVSFGLIREGASAVRSVRVLATQPSYDVPEPKVTIEKNDEEYFSAELREYPNQTGHEVRVSLSDTAPVGRHEAVLKIEFEGELAKESREMPITVIVKAQQ